MSKYTEVFDSKEILMQITDDEYTHCLNKAKSDLEAHQKKQLNSDYKLQHIEYRQSQLQSRIIGVCAEYAFKKHYKMINDDFFCQLFDEGYDISLKNGHTGNIKGTVYNTGNLLIQGHRKQIQADLLILVTKYRQDNDLIYRFAGWTTKKVFNKRATSLNGQDESLFMLQSELFPAWVFNERYL